MYNYEGILYRIWGVGGIFVLLGIGCLFVSRMNKISADKECILAGILCIIWGISSALYYGFCYAFPQVESIQCTFVEEYRNSRVAPPLPFTMEYTFLTEEGYTELYLDVFSEKNVLEEKLDLEKEYIVFYEARTDIIVGIVSPK